MGSRQCLGQADRDRRSVTTAVEDQHVRLQLPQKKASINVGAADLDLPLNVASLSGPIRDDPPHSRQRLDLPLNLASLSRLSHRNQLSKRKRTRRARPFYSVDLSGTDSSNPLPPLFEEIIVLNKQSVREQPSVFTHK